MDLKASDDTDPNRVLRRIRTINGRKIKTRQYFESTGAERIPQKSIKVMRSRYRLTMWDYWSTGDPRIRERAERMSKYVKSPDPEQGASRFLEKVSDGAGPTPDTEPGSNWSGYGADG